MPYRIVHAKVRPNTDEIAGIDAVLSEPQELANYPDDHDDIGYEVETKIGEYGYDSLSGMSEPDEEGNCHAIWVEEPNPA